MSEDKRPPERIAVRFCPKCGRDDTFKDFGAKHYFRGTLCPGKPVVVKYGLLRPKE